MTAYNLEAGSIQHQFYLSRNTIQIFGGAFANGKTTAACIKAINLARDFPGSNGLIARETFPKLNDTIRKVFLEWCPPAWVKKRPTDSDNTCYLTNGSVINFRYVAQRGKTREDGSTTSNLLSATYDWIVVDQIEDPGIMHKDFLDLLGRLRGNTPYKPPAGVAEDMTMPSSGPRWLILTSNPTHNWFYKDIVQPYIIWRDKGLKMEKLLVDKTGTPIIDLFEGSTYTNQKNLPPDYIEALEASYKGQMRERFLMGKWAAFEGLVHPDFSSDRNVLSRAQIMSHMFDCVGRHVKLRMIEGYDFGLVSPSCYLMGFIDDYGRIFILEGFYEKEFHYEDQPEAIKKLRTPHEPYVAREDPIRADPAIWKRSSVGKNRSVSTSVYRLLSELGLELSPGGNEILGGIAKVNAYITGRRNTPHIITGERPGPLLYVNEELEFIQDEVFSYYWKRNPQGQNIDEPLDNNDHAMNTLKYMLSKRPDPSEIIVPSSIKAPEWMYWQEVEEQYAQRV